VEQLCAGTADATALRRALVEEVQRTVGFDAYAWLLTDPETEVGASPLADVPCVGELPRLIRLKYLTPLNRWTAMDRPVALLGTGDRRDRSLLWRELLARHGVDDVASLVFRDQFGCWGLLDLWRIGGGAGFSEREAAVLEAVTGPVTEALRRAQAGTFALAAAGQDWTGPVVLVLSPELEVVAQSPGTEAVLRVLVPPPGDQRPIPAAAYNVAAQLLAVEAGVDVHPPLARVHLGDGVWLTLRAARIGDGRRGEAQQIAVTIEPARPADRTAVFVRACGLSPREAELVGHLVDGCDTRELARRMYLSAHTVQDHLKSVFTKTGARTRRAVVARAVGR
jgi:DNA-binding CsgD family transcriptional regulator